MKRSAPRVCVKMTVAEAMRAMGARLVGGPELAERQVCGVSTDSRSVQAGDVFFAVKGQRCDGHDFWLSAATGGAAAVVLHREPEAPAPVAIPVLVVSDTTAALGDLARAWRLQLNAQVVAITGSVGKTTTKELLRQILVRVAPTHANPGNFNNHIGLPLTLLGAPAETRFLVVELGMSALGEIATLTDIARPDVGAITAIAPVHLETLGTVEHIAQAKAELLAGLGSQAVAIVPADESLLKPYLERFDSRRRIRFGSGPDAQVRIQHVQALGPAGLRVDLTLRGAAVTVNLPLVGRHNAHNAAAAAAIALALGVGVEVIVEGLEQAPELGHRSRTLRLGDWNLLDDCYNASPVAMRAALDALLDLAADADAIAILGPMLELGHASEQLHRDVGAHVAHAGLSCLITVGSEAAQIATGARAAGMPTGRVRAVQTAQEAAEALGEAASPGCWILLKGSRGARLEQVLEHVPCCPGGPEGVS